MRWAPIMPSGGVNLFDAQTSIRDDECVRAKNLVPVPPGRLSKRGGLARPIVTMDLLSAANEPTAGVICPISGSEADAVILARNAPGPSTLVGASLVSGEFASCYAPFDNLEAYLFAWAGKAYVLPGPTAAWYVPAVGADPASSGFPFYLFDSSVVGTRQPPVGLAFAGTGNENVYPRYAFPYKQRLVLANFGRGYENTIVFTNNYTADVVGNDVLASNGRAINLVAGADGDEIVAGIEVMLTNVGSPAEAGLLLLRRHGNPFLLTGDMDQTTGGTSTLDIKRISINCGCAGQYTVARTPHGIIWAGVDDVWAFAVGVLPTRIGQKIQPALKVSPVRHQLRWRAVYFDGFYRLSIWGEGQLFDHYLSPPGDTWWLDLRDGLPQDWRAARWWGPQQYLGHGASGGTAPSPGVFLMMAENRAGKPARLYYVDSTDTTGVPSNGLSIGEVSNDETRDITNPVAAIADEDLVDHEIVSELITKEYTLAPPYQQINDGIAGTVRTLHDVRFTATYSLDDGAAALTRNKYIKVNSPFQLDADTLDTAANLLNNKVAQFSIYPATRRAASSHQFKLADTAGWTVVAGHNDSVAVALDPGTGAYTYWVGTVTPGCYSISELVTAVTTAINAGKPATSNNWGLTSAAGVYTLNAGGPYGVGVTMSVRFITSTLIAPDNGTAPTAAQALACRRLFAILGFAITGNALNAGPGLNPTIAGATAPFKKGVAHYELYGLQANFEVIPRTP